MISQKFFHWLLLVSVGFFLTACGGGGSDSGESPFGGGTGGGTSVLSIQLSLSNTTVTAISPVTVTAQVLIGSKAISGALVNFSVPGGLGVLSPATALTDSQGRARASLTPANSTVGGADLVQATVTTGNASAQSTTGFQLTATATELLAITPAVGNGDAPSTPVVAYGQGDLTVSMRGVSGAAPATVSFSSACVAAQKAVFSPVTVTSTTNSVSVVYKDKGCGALYTTDTVTVTMAGNSSQVQGIVYLTQPAPRSVKFISAIPATIYLKGSGLEESSTVTFQVNDQAGNPLPGKKVQMRIPPDIGAGGLKIDGYGVDVPVIKTTDAAGKVAVIVNSGTVPLPVRIEAQLVDDGTTKTVSNVLSVGVGLPSQLNFSLSQKTINLDCYTRDGTTNKYYIYAADRSGNPVPADTAITFVAEGGQIVTNVKTVLSAEGIASAEAAFVCQEPRPADGRVTITAYAVGEESFVDLDGNNVYDLGEPFQDLGDIVKDVWFDNIFDATRDEHIPLGGTGTCNKNFEFSYPQFVLDARTPTRPTTCDNTWTSRNYVRRAVETVMSTSSAGLAWISPSGLTASCSTQSISNAPDNSTFVKSYPLSSSGNHLLYGGAIGAFSFYVADANGRRWNPMAAGTTIGISGATTGLTVSVNGSPVPNSSTVTTAGIQYELKDVTSGSFTINVTSPSGLITSYPVGIDSTTPPSMCTK